MLNIIRKDIVTFDVLLNSKLKAINIYNILHNPKFNYKLLLISIIQKNNYLILAKKEKITVFNNKNKFTLKATKIRISYLVNILVRKIFLALAFLYLVPYNYIL